jgi:hypothetical protein
MLTVRIPSVVMRSVINLSIVTLSVTMPSVIKLSVSMPSVIVASVVMLIVAAPFFPSNIHRKLFCSTSDMQNVEQ